MRTIFLLVLAAALYFGLKTDAPTPAKPWYPYAQNKQTGKLEFFWSNYASKSECEFYQEQTVAAQKGWYGYPTGCFYQGYQSPYVLWITNAFIDRNSLGCIARVKERSKFEDPIYIVILHGYSPEPGGNWECAL